jgi:two-component system chemotaxis response regulator CheY
MDQVDKELWGRLDVLIVDDIAPVRSLLQIMLRNLGVGGHIDEAADGLEAWSILQQRSYGLILCDVNMPRMTGLELRKQMCNSNLHEFTPFLFYTGEISEELLATAAESNCDYFLKPFRINKLAQVIRATLTMQNIA